MCRHCPSVMAIIPPTPPMSEQVTQESVQKLEQGGHRADIRAVALSADDSLLLSASNSAVKVGRIILSTF